MPFIESIATALPAYCHQQKDILKFMQGFVSEQEQRKLSMIYRQSGIKQRYSVLSDYSKEIRQWDFFPRNAEAEPFPNVESRMKLFHKEALELAEKAIRQLEDWQNVTHLVTVTCTGLSAPGLDIALIKRLNLPPEKITRYSINFMGCYAGLQALRLADTLCKADTKARVLLVDVELCTLHFQKTPSEDNYLANALFADGAAASIISNNTKAAWQMLDFHSDLILQAENDMAWQVSSTGFLMTLSAYIPQILKENMKKLVEKALAKTKISIEQIHTWAIHPGGKRILDEIQKVLPIEKEAIQASYDVLTNYGNMSSVTIFFVLKEIWQRNGNVFACGFGPGLTMESILLQKNTNTETMN
jgi:predicted naringenin-chalcone synthase